MVPLGEEVARKLSVDPLIRLALRGVVPIPSAVAAIETDVDLHYIDLEGEAATYSGPVAAFNRTQAKRIVGARWEPPRDGTMRNWSTPVGQESTEAIANVRDNVRGVRSVILSEVPGTDVAVLEDEEATVEISSILAGADLTAQPVEVKRAVQRVDATEPDATPDPLATARRAAESAREIADKAALVVADARVIAAGIGTGPANVKLSNLESWMGEAKDYAVLAEAAAALAETTTGAEQKAAAEKAVTYNDEVLWSYEKGLSSYEALQAM